MRKVHKNIKFIFIIAALSFTVSVVNAQLQPTWEKNKSKSGSEEFKYPLYEEARQLYANETPYNLSEETYTFSEVWRSSEPVQNEINFIPASYHSPIATHGNSTFVLYVDQGHRLKIVKITDDGIEEAFIDNMIYQPDEFYANHDNNPNNNVSEPDYHRFKEKDGHHSVSIGIDKNGYLHLIGDMHNYPVYENPQKHLPLRYAYKKVIYWRSDNPLDISSFSFLGDQADKVPQGVGFTYCNFFNDLDGNLYFTSRAHQKDKTRCSAYSKYDASTGTWSVVGGIANGEEGYPRLFWEDNGEGGSKYNKTHPIGVFDRDNNMHVSAPILSNNESPQGAIIHFCTDILYLKSTDGGQSFTKADGSPVLVPARSESGPNQADVVFSAKYLGVSGNIAVDYENNPYTVAQVKSAENTGKKSQVIGWNGTNWHNYGEIVSSNTDFRLIHDPAGVMNYIGDSNSDLYRFWNPADPLHKIDLPWSIRVIDYEYLKKTGNIMGLAKDGDNLKVVKVTITRPGMELITPEPKEITNHAPEITSLPYFDGSKLTVAATDADGDPLTYTWYKSYGNGELTFSENGNAESSTTIPQFSKVGNYELKVAVSDGTVNTIATLIVHVQTVSSKNLTEMEDVNIYPNPASDFLKVEFGKNLNGKVVISDLLGKVLHVESFQGQSLNINTSELNSGIVILNVISENASFKPQKIVIK
ncbi:MAG: BNR-4 repeat-containing protein [Draconibacterium sp.]|nr:BNR-4 repeat-containing protein [Draconibacterium sp.]